jgi:hypothetical protein
MNIFLGETGTESPFSSRLGKKKIRVFHDPTEPNTLPQKKERRNKSASRQEYISHI